MKNITPVGKDELSALARQGREALETIASGESKILRTVEENANAMRKAWMVYGAVLAQARKLIPGKLEFGRWVKTNKLDQGLAAQKSARAAAVQMVRNWPLLEKNIGALRNISTPSNVMIAARKANIALTYQEPTNAARAQTRRAKYAIKKEPSAIIRDDGPVDTAEMTPVEQQALDARGWKQRAEMAAAYGRYADAVTCPNTKEMRALVADAIAAWSDVLKTLDKQT